MAEFVLRRSEEMLPELEQMQRIGLFQDDEIKAIVKKTMSHEYKLVRRVKVKKDFLAYIQYKILLLALIKKRRDSINYYFKKDEIEIAIVGKIHRLFKQCIFRWPEDLKLWMSHVEFCKGWNKKIQLSKIWTALLQLHGNTNINLWAMAAKWELEDNHSVDNARQIFLRGIRHHPNDPKLWQEYFRMELIHVLTTRQRLAVLKEEDQCDGEGPDEDFLKGKAAIIVYNNAIKSLPNDSRYICGFLEISLQFSFFAGEVINAIIDNITEEYNNDEHARSMMAKLHLHPSLLNDPTNTFTQKADAWTAEKKCWEDFESAVEELKSTKMWTGYISFLGERIDANNPDSNNDEVNFEVLRSSKKVRRNDIVMETRIEKYFTTARKAHELKVLHTDCYVTFVDRLIKQNKIDEAVKILQDIIKDSESATLLLKLIEILVTNEQCAKENIDIISLIDELSDSKMDIEQEEKLFDLWFRHAKKENNEELLLKAISVAEKSKSPIATGLKTRYLQWQVSLHGAKNGFEKYKSTLNTLCAPSLELTKNIIELLEESELALDQMIIDCYEDAVDKFGSVNPDLWLRYVKRMLIFDATKIGKIHWRAMKYLKPELVEQFVSGYTLLLAKIVTEE